MSDWETAMRAACIQSAAILLQRGGQIAPDNYDNVAKLSIDLYEAYLREFDRRRKK